MSLNCRVSITIGRSGLPLIAYCDPSEDLHVYACNDLLCSAGNTSDVLSVGVGSPTPFKRRQFFSGAYGIQLTIAERPCGFPGPIVSYTSAWICVVRFFISICRNQRMISERSV